MIKFKSFEESIAPTKGQHFDYQITDYVYNSDTKLLSVSPNKKDIFEKINSYASSSLDAVLDKYSSLSQLDVSQPIVTPLDTDLSHIAEAFDKAEEYRFSRNLSSDLSYKQIYELMLQESEAINKNLTKGGVKDEKKTSFDEKCVEKVVHENGEKSSQT